MTTTLYWLTNDLRLDDNPALIRAANSDRLLCVYCIDERWFSPHRYHVRSMGAHRWRFLSETLDQLSLALRALNQELIRAYGHPLETLATLIRARRVTRLLCSRQKASDEREVLRRLQERFPKLRIDEVDTHTLFEHDSLPCPMDSLPKGYTPFREAAEEHPVPACAQAPKSLPMPPLGVVTDVEARPDWLPPVAEDDDSPFRGGEIAGHDQLSWYLSGQLPQEYKHTRDALEGWEHSSKLSPWLALGCLSPRRIKRRLDHYEAQRGGNESTDWLWRELLWREYFQWLALHADTALFRYRGLKGKAGRRCLHPERYQKWCHGNTPYPLVNACMRELKETGYLSNRGRQIAASCFINELELDWRYGAAWFEHQLIDYDVSVNWGNWQYLAGVGVDPRGGRHFNLESQTERFDPDGTYRQRWAPDAPLTRLDSVDAADWPVEPDA